MLTTDNHRRDSAGLRYVYPVISRRAGGVSIGINLNPNNACNWACVYCQVENLTRGGPPPLDLGLLEQELDTFLFNVLQGAFMQTQVPAEARRLKDVAFSGNGEPTSAPEFAEAVACVSRVLSRHALNGKLPVRLITNGSLMHRAAVKAGIQGIGELGGEVWFKLDRAIDTEIAEVNGFAGRLTQVAKNLELCANLAPTWVQTCWFKIDGFAPAINSERAYFALLRDVGAKLQGIHLYGLARPSMQPSAHRLSPLSSEELTAFGSRIEKETGIKVIVSP